MAGIFIQGCANNVKCMYISTPGHIVDCSEFICVMLLALKEGNTTVSIHPCCSLHVLNMIIKSGASVDLYSIYVIISSLIMPLIDCSIILLSFSLYLHSFALNLRQPIHSSAFSLCFLISLQHCKDIIVSLCCGFKQPHAVFTFFLSFIIWSLQKLLSLSPSYLSINLTFLLFCIL